jgi:hypothetical protein
MAIFIEGVRGSGKTKIAVREIQIYLNMGLRVATNLDIDVSKLSPNTKSVLTRIPDQPRSIDLELLGKSYPELNPDDPSTYDEKKFGLIVIDELLTSFNSRNWNDPDRLAVVSWMVQSRKLGWRLMLLCQDADAVDKQLRETLLQEIWHCRSGKNFFSSPVLGKIFGLFTAPLYKIIAPYGFHYCAQYTGKKKDKSHLAASEFYKLYHLHQCYKTSQNFVPDNFINRLGKLIDMRASYSVLPSDYFSKPTKTEIKPDTVKTPATGKPLYKDWRVIALVLMGFTYFFLPQENVSQDKSQILSTDISPGKMPSDEQPKPEQPTKTEFQTLVDGLVITCSVLYAQGATDYCFENKDGTFYPSDLGFTVNYVAPCAARVSFGDESKVIRCRPNYMQSESTSIAAIAPAPDEQT